jgi:exopolyphosphatase/guanosine-5'-triphosphate,3'-diphosphate pyrophosphatase
VGTFATLDVGSNSVKLLVASIDKTGKWDILENATEITRLGEGVQASGEINSAAMRRNISVISRYMQQARALGAREFAAVGTMCLRTARNAALFIAQVRRECGLQIEIINGQEEARLSYLAVLSWLHEPAGTLAIFDVGGGSTEFVFGQGREITASYSLDIGAVRLTEEFLKSDPVTEAELKRMLAAVSESCGQLAAAPAIQTLVGVGGTVTTLAAIKQELAAYDPDVVQGSLLTSADVAELLERFRARTIQQRQDIVGLNPKRADIILAGTGIVKVIFQHLGMKALLVSDRGVRHGLMYDRFRIRSN